MYRCFLRGKRVWVADVLDVLFSRTPQIRDGEIGSASLFGDETRWKRSFPYDNNDDNDDDDDSTYNNNNNNNNISIKGGCDFLSEG